MQNETARSWLTRLGQDELRLAKKLGWDHPEVLEAQHRFRDAYQAVKSIRNSYESLPAERTHGQQQ